MTSDAATLRAAAAIVEVKAQQGQPHLIALTNRLLTLAAQLGPEPTTDTDEQEDTYP